jgi:hypothetical protein
LNKELLMIRQRQSGLYVLLLMLGISLGSAVAIFGQQATVTSTYPTMPQNVAQWSGTTVTAAAALSDTSGNPTAPQIGADGMVWDTTQWVRRKGTALATFPTAVTLTSRNAVGAAVMEHSSRWSVIHNPAASSQATASIAAEGSVRHIADCISFSAGSTTAPALTALTVNLRDGATGAGTIIWTHEVVISNATGQNVLPYSQCGLNLPGTTNTALTLEFSALLTNLIESVSLSGFNLQ